MQLALWEQLLMLVTVGLVRGIAEAKDVFLVFYGF